MKSRVTDTHKRCPRCKVWKLYDEFYRYFPRRGNGLSAYCKICVAERSREWIAKNRRKKLYNLSEERYATMWKEQGGLCAISGCGRPIRDIDHNHKTNVVRGLLCCSCNRALGFFRDSSILLRNAALYLEKFEKI